MKAFFAFVTSAIAAVPFVAADAVPSGFAAHFFTTQREGLVFAPEGGFPSAELIATAPGDGSFKDITALFPTQGSGTPGQLAIGDWCVSAEGVVPGTATQTLFIEDCSNSAKQIWTVNEDGTVSNADGNCVTLGRPAQNVPVSLAACTDELKHLQTWNDVPVSSN